jgi:flagellar hook-length control protein FliK
LLSALSAPVKALKANTSLPADNYSPAADKTGLPVNKLTPAKDFAETLGQAQVNFLSADDAASVKQVFALDAAQVQNNESVSADALNGHLSEAPVLPETVTAPATAIGNQVPENGKTAPLEVFIHATQGNSQFTDEPAFESQTLARVENHPGSNSAAVNELPVAGLVADGVTRINEASHAKTNATSEMPLAIKTDPHGKTPADISIKPAQTLGNSAVLPSAPILERAGIAPDNKLLQQQRSENAPVSAESARNAVSADLMRGAEMPKLPEGVDASSMSKLLSAGRMEATETQAQPQASKLRSAEIKTDALNANPAASKPVLEKTESNQLAAGALKSAFASSAIKNSGETVAAPRNEPPGPWIQPVEPRTVNPERIVADALQVRVDAQPVNSASLRQRQVEQRLSNQGSDTKRLQAELAATLDTRVSAESSDRAVIAQPKIESATSVLPKQAGSPAMVDPQLNSRQVDTAVQDQILRVMSRQALTQGRLTLQLNPHELGSLDIEFSTEKGEVQVAIVARETSTRDLLEASVARLRQSLQEGGVNVGQLDIRQGDRQSEEQGARESMHQNVTADSAAPAAVHEDVVSPSRTDEGGIHIYV